MKEIREQPIVPNKKYTRLEIRKKILTMNKPFCISELFRILEGSNKELILQVLDDLYQDGLIVYKKSDGIVEDADCFFKVA